MVDLNIFFERGFSNDSIEITINSIKNYQREGITTHPDLGLAESMTVDVPTGNYNIKISIKNRQITKAINCNILKTTYLALSVSNNTGINHRFSEKPFKYL